MQYYQGHKYNDDRLFILDLVRAKKTNRTIWAVITRHNYEGFPPFRVDEFASEEEAKAFILKIEPTTPRISLGGNSFEIPISYEAYCQLLESENIPTCLEIYEINKSNNREIILDTIQNNTWQPPQPNMFLYKFAHTVLPILALGNPRKFYSDVSGRNGKEYLLNLWAGVERKMNTKQSSERLNVSKEDLRSDIQVIIIQMPQAKNVPEAIWIGIAFRIKKQIVKTIVYSSRYFTLELGKQPNSELDGYFFCEWIGVLKSQHRTYEQLPNSNESTFLWAIDRAMG